MRSWLLASTILCCASAGLSSPSFAQQPTPASTQSRAVQFAIPAQPLPAALDAFIRATGWQVGYSTRITDGHRSAAVNGTMPPAQALRMLLAGTGINVRLTGANTATLINQNVAVGGLPDGAISLETIDVQGASSSDPGRTEGTGSYTTDQSSFGKNQTLRELPQTVSVITHQRIQDQALTTMDDALVYAPGITVQQENTATSTFYSRGFPITNFQIDGNSPLYGGAGGFDGGLNTNQLDLAMFDRVEILRGSDALYGTSGEPGGAINLVRKKPTKQFQMNALTHGGSWSNYRGEVDVGGPLTANGSVRGRLVGAYEDRKYFYDYGKSNRYLLYGIIEADITDSTMLTFGANVLRQDYGAFSPYGLPRYSSGADIGLPRSFYLGTPDDRWLRNNNTQFVRIDQELGTNWTLGIEASRAQSKNLRKDMNWWGPVDPATGAGVYGRDRIFNYNETQETVDAVLKGALHLFGREHKLTLGANVNRRESYSLGSGNPNATYVEIPNLFEFDPADYRYNGPYAPLFDSKAKVTQKGVYGSFVAQITDPLKLIFGGRLSWYNYDNVSNSFNAGTGAVSSTSLTSYQENRIFTPYLGLVYDLSKQWSAYASAAETYKSQASSLKGPLPGTPLGPVTGRTYEVGVKGSLLDGRLNTTLALYHIKRNGEAVRDLAYPPTPGDLGSNCCFLDDGRVVSQGVDIEVSGEIAAGWRISAGYTFNDNENKAANGQYSTITPKHLFKMWTSYAFQGQFEGWKIGGGVTAQSSFYRKGTARAFNTNSGQYDGPSVPFEFTEPGRAVVDLFVQYRVDEHWTVALNVNNVFDKKYYQSVTDQNPGAGNFYGAPRNFLLSARTKF